MQKLILKTEIKDKEGEITKVNEKQIKIPNADGIITDVQIRDFLSSEDYFKYVGLTPSQEINIKNPIAPDTVSTSMIVKSQPSQYHIILAMVINPKLTDQMLRKMDYRLQTELFLAVQQFCFPQDEANEPFTGASEQQTEQ